MFRTLCITIALAWTLQPGWAQEARQPADPPSPPEHAAIRERLRAYVDAFNKHEAGSVAKFWSADGVSLADDSGERIEGRAALETHFTTFFHEHPTTQLTGEVTEIRLARPDVATIEGRTTLFVADDEPLQSAFTALLIKDGDDWLISSSHERDLPAPSSREALQELEWLVGTWTDENSEGLVTTTVRWSPHEAFLIRSFAVQSPDADALQGTQVIGWDPLRKQIRTWTFNSDGSFGEGTLSRHDDSWLLKMWQVRSDGQLAEGTQVITRVDHDTLTMQFIGESVDGEPLPSADPVTVVRVVETEEAPADAAPKAEGAKP